MIISLIILILVVLELWIEEKNFQNRKETLRALHKQRALRAQERLLKMGLIKEIPSLED